MACLVGTAVAILNLFQSNGMASFPLVEEHHLVVVFSQAHSRWEAEAPYYRYYRSTAHVCTWHKAGLAFQKRAGR